MSLLLGTRGSALARIQSTGIARLLRDLDPALEIRLEIIQSLGDKVLNRPLDRLGRTGVFTAELETALLEGRIDLAVHSLKDLPTDEHPELMIVAIPEREDPRDVLVFSERRSDPPLNGPREWASIPLLPYARVGTGSHRRRAQLLYARKDLRILDLRGNVDTRLKKLDAGEYDACIFAAAGLRRLGIFSRAGNLLKPDLCMPDPGQGALAVQIRQDRKDLREWLKPLDDPNTRACTTAERAVLSALGGGCSTPVGALAAIEPDGRLRLRAVAAHPEGDARVSIEISGNPEEATAIGRRAAEQLLSAGAAAFLKPEKGTDQSAAGR